MLSLKQFFSSKTIWALALTFLFNGFQAVHPVVDSGTATKINEGLAVLAAAGRIANTQNK